MRNQDFESREASSDVKDLASEGDSEAANGVSASSTSSSTSSSPASSSRSSLTERLQSLLLVGDDGAGNEADLVYDGDELENGVIRWLRALDLQVLGACRAEERLNPFVKVRNVSSRTGDDRLMSQLSQHFDASEVGMLVRCLCVPLVSIRVGKVLKQGNLLCPTTTRGHLNLTLLPSSDMRITFCGDDGYNEKMGVVPHNFECFEVSIEEISADRSGLSFCLKLSMDQVAYFWCSEKSKLHGVELLEKMKRLLQRSPSLSQLTGICQTRLDSFAIHMRAYFVVSTCSTEQPSGSLSDSSYVVAMTSFPQGSELNDVSSSSNTKNSHSRLNIFRPGKGHPIYQGSLSPRLNTFKDGALGGLSFLGSGIRGILERSGNINTDLFVSTSLDVTKSFSDVQPSSKSCHFDEGKLKEGNDNLDSSLVELPCLTSPASYFSSLNLHFPLPQLPPLTSPYYCWSPPSTSSFQNIATPSVLPSMAAESSPMPPLSSLLSSSGSLSFLPKEPSLEQSQLPVFELPSILPGSSYVSMSSSSQQILTFEPFMTDPIVHIPVIGVCSSGPGYLVSAGPTITSTLPPCLLRSCASLTEESMVEKNARETLRMLMASTPTNPQFMQVLNTVQENLSGSRNGMVAARSCELYTGAQGVDVKSNFCLMGFTSSSTKTEVSGDFVTNIENSSWNNLDGDISGRNEKDIGKDVTKESEP